MEYEKTTSNSGLAGMGGATLKPKDSPLEERLIDLSQAIDQLKEEVDCIEARLSGVVENMDEDHKKELVAEDTFEPELIKKIKGRTNRIYQIITRLQSIRRRLII